MLWGGNKNLFFNKFVAVFFIFFILMKHLKHTQLQNTCLSYTQL